MRHRWLFCLSAILMAGGATGAMPAPLGSTSTQRAVDQMNSSSMRGVPAAPAPVRPRSDTIWVPDRWVSAPGMPAGVFEPGHWVIYTPEGGRIAPPPPIPSALQGP